mgnify:CR=1 FL=1
MENYAIEMLNITKRFPGIIANDNITLQLKKWRDPRTFRRKWRGKINTDECTFWFVSAGGG